jgi:hypothetical protein
LAKSAHLVKPEIVGKYMAPLAGLDLRREMQASTKSHASDIIFIFNTKRKNYNSIHSNVQSTNLKYK